MKKLSKNKSYLYGKNSVFERLTTNPRSIKKVYLEHNFKAADILNALKSVPTPVEHRAEKDLLRIKKADRLQGIVAEVTPFAYTPLEDIIISPSGHINPMALLYLDNLNDPHNLGSIIRSVACLGNFAIIIPEHSSCQVNDTVMHVASGGENYVPVAMVKSTSSALRKIKDAGYWVVGTTVDAKETLFSTKLPFPLCLILGSEGKGIRPGVTKLLDSTVTLPMDGASLSLNVAMAAAIFCYEIARQRK